MAHLRVEMEGGGNDGVGIGSDHIDTRNLLGGLNEEPEQDTAESLSFATLEEFLVTEWGSTLLSLE